MSLHEASAAPRPETQWEGGPAHASWILATAGPKGQTRGVKGAWCRPGVQGVRMAETAELMSLRRAIDDVRRCVAVLRDRRGDIPSVRRLVGDVERLDLDAADLESAAAASRSGASSRWAASPSTRRYGWTRTTRASAVTTAAGTSDPRAGAVGADRSRRTGRAGPGEDRSAHAASRPVVGTARRHGRGAPPVRDLRHVAGVRGRALLLRALPFPVLFAVLDGQVRPAKPRTSASGRSSDGGRCRQR